MTAAKSRAAKVGLPPGSLVHVGEPQEGPARLQVLDYDASRVEEHELESPEALRAYLSRPSVTWLNVVGVHDVAAVAAVGRILGIHPLVLEDVVNTRQRPKAEGFDEYAFVVAKMIRFDEQAGRLGLEHVSLVVGRGFVVTFQERSGDVLDPLRERIREGVGRVRAAGADYLAYCVLDLLVDHYFLALEGLGGRIEDLEEPILSDPSPEVLQAIHEAKRAVGAVRKAVWPLREALLYLERDAGGLVDEATRPYLRDVYDHCVQVIDTVETYRDLLAGYLDVYLSSLSNRMNEVMKTLTVIATIFIPLTFLAGVYGMNFEHMPELKWRWGYPAVWAVMVAVGIGMVRWFRRRGWL